MNLRKYFFLKVWLFCILTKSVGEVQLFVDNIKLILRVKPMIVSGIDFIPAQICQRRKKRGLKGTEKNEN